MTAIPDATYLRFQTLSQTIHNRMQWSYERIHFDPTPIDVAVIGDSRMAAGVNAPALSDALSQRLGRQVDVVNLSTPQEGRDLHWTIVRELLTARPEVSLILLSVIEQEPRVTHPAFASLGSRMDILSAPLLFNRDWLTNIASLPYRQVSLFVKALLPSWFGLNRDFVAASYSGPSYDSTRTFEQFDGRVIDRDSVQDEAKLRRTAADRLEGITPPLLPERFSDYEFAIERSYTRRIAQLAAEKGVRVGFIYLPIYTNDGAIHNRDFYTEIGPIFDGRQFIDAPAEFSDYGHLNHAGALAVVPWLSEEIAHQIDTGWLQLKRPAVPGRGGEPEDRN